jgi:hypothetical protein
VKTGKKLPSDLDQIVKSFATPRPMRLMFQDEVRFGRISDTSVLLGTVPGAAHG